MFIKKSFFLVFIFLVFYHIINAQPQGALVNSKHVTNYTEDEYGHGFNAQFWSVCQDDDGLMYFGNSYNILTFDGIHWNSILVSKESGYVSAILPAANNIIYWGYNGDLGLIRTMDNGKQISESLLNKIPELDRYFSVVWRIYEYKNQIVFFTQESIFIYNPSLDSMQIIYPEESFHLAFVANNELYVRDRSFGLRMFDGNDFQNVKGGDIFHNEGIFGIIPTGENKLMIITQLIGLYSFDKDGIKSIDSPDIEELNKLQIIGATKLIDNNIALNTGSNGVVIINQKGIIQCRINMTSGIADNDVKQLHLDQYNKLWLATNNGISVINYSSPISLYLNSDKSGLYGSVNCIEMNSDLFVGTTTGLYKYTPNKKHAFELVNNLSKNINCLFVADNKLFIGTSDAAYMLYNNELKKIATIDASAFLYSIPNYRLYVIGKNGIVVLQKKHDWLKVYENKEITLDAIEAIIENDESLNDQLWIGTQNQGLWNLHSTKDIKNGFEIIVYQEDDYLPSGWVIPFKYNKKLYVGTKDGLYQLEQIKDDKSDSLNLYKPYFIPASDPKLTGIITHITSFNDDYYVVNNSMIGQIKKDSSIDFTPFLSLEIGKINALLAHNNSRIWIGANNGIARVDLSWKKDYAQKSDIKINRLHFTNDSVLFYKPHNKEEYILDYQNNSFVIQYSSLYDENGNKPLFSHKLDGFDDEWSEWTKDTKVSYKKLGAGSYSFNVRAKNIYNVISDSTKIDITISAPWYQTWWAIMFYAIALILIISAIVKAYTYRLKQQNQQLEEIINERTKEIRHQKDEIGKQHDMIKEVHQEIQSSIAYAKRIQTAVLPEQEFVQPNIKDYFIFFKPKDVVSGDFYWAKQNGDYLVIAVADCTGHGVPGAFMSMLGISLLNEIVGREQGIEAGIILDQLRNGVIHSLRQSTDSSDVKDGMDISLVSINLKTNEISWAGAHNPLFIVSDNELSFNDDTKYKIHESKDFTHRLFDIKADKMPIAISGRMQPFKTHNIKMQPGDTIYMFSDGYIDQFGGPKGKKFMIKAFRNFTINNFENELKIQKENFEHNFNQWVNHKGSNTHQINTQIDDICVMGIRF